MPRGGGVVAARSGEGTTAAVRGEARPTVAPARGGVVVVGGAADDPEAVDYFKVMYAKRSKKKHKSYLDGTACFHPVHRLALFSRCAAQFCVVPTLLVMFCWMWIVRLTEVLVPSAGF